MTEVRPFHLDLRFLPLLDVLLLDLEVDPLDLLVAAEDLNPAQQRLKVVQHRAGCLQEPGQSDDRDFREFITLFR